MSLWELRAARRQLAAEGRALIDERALFAARAANEALVASATTETRRQRREVVKRQRRLAEAADIAPVLTPQPVAETEEGRAPVSDFQVEIEPW